MPQVTDTSLHDIRKMVKDMRYILDYGKNNQPDLQKKGISIHDLKTTASRIETYNDQRMFLFVLTKYMRQQKQQPSVSETRRIIAKWQRQKHSDEVWLPLEH